MMNTRSDINNLPDYSSDPQALIVFGGGGHGKTLVELVKAQQVYYVVGIIDDNENLKPGMEICGVPVLGNSEILPTCYQHGIRLAVNGIGGIGNVDLRVKIFDLLESFHFAFPAVVHPTAWVEESAVLEPGVQVLAHSYVGSDVHVGFGTVLNVGVCLSHDVITGRVDNFSPGAKLAGEVVVGDYTQVGMNATINVKVHIGSHVKIGNGATVKKDVKDNNRVHAGAVSPRVNLMKYFLGK